MVTGPIQPSTVLATGRPPLARQPRPTLLGDVHALARALAGPAVEPRWRERVGNHLEPVRRGFADHVRVTEGPSGLYAELLVQAPRLDRGVRLLTGEHAAIVTAIGALHRAVHGSGAPAGEVLARVGHLLRILDRHRQHGADLLWEAYQTDLGGET
jgi:hypothetical protein